MQMATKDATQKKPKMGWVVIVGIGCAGIALVSFCCVLILVLMPRNPNTRTDTIGTLVVDSSGGVFENDEIRVQIPAGAVQKRIELTVSRDRSAPDRLQEFDEISDGYQISGPIAAIHGEIEIRLQLQKKILANGGALVLEEAAYAPSFGEVTHILPLPTEIDMENQTATGALRLEGQSGVGNASFVPAAGINTIILQLFKFQDDVDDSVRVRFVPGIIYNAYESRHFTISYLGKLHDADIARQAVDLLEEQYQKITDMGFEFRGIDRIQVTVKYLDNRTGQFVSSMRGSSYTSLELNSEFFKDKNKFNQNQGELKATIGHELLHMAQFSLDPRYAYFKAKSPGPLLWIDEAVATWFESYAVDDPNYVPQNASRMSNFVNDSLFMPPSDYNLAQDHGYGASLLIKFLSSQYSPFFPAEIYNEVAGGAANGGEALMLALQRHQTDMDAEWPLFLQRYYTEPESFGDQLNPPAIQFVKLKASSLNEQDEYAIAFYPSKGLMPRQHSSEEGRLYEGTPASIELDFERGPLSAEAFYVILDAADSSMLAFQYPATFLITVDAPEDSGVLVVGQMGEGGPFAPLAGAPFGYLSSGDSFSESGSQMMVDGFGNADGEGYFTRLLLIPFNHHNDFSGGGDTTHIRVQLTYWTQLESIPPDPGLDEWPTEIPEQPTEIPFEPTESPAQPESSHACSGVSVSDMQNRTLKSRQCWIVCFGIGGASPSEGEIQSCIDSNQ